jgi:hypothetical protein
MMHRIPPPDAALPLATTTGGVTAVRVLAGNLAAIPVGALLEATVTRANPKEAVLTVNGQPLTIRPTVQLHEGAVLLIRIPQGTQPQTLEMLQVASSNSAERSARSRLVLSGAGVSQQQAASQPSNSAGLLDALPRPAHHPLNVAVVDVLAALGDGRWRVRLNGNEEISSSAEPLTPGGRYVMQVHRLPSGLLLHSLPNSPRLAEELPAAILRSSQPPDFAALVRPVIKELTGTQLQAVQGDSSTSRLPGSLRTAAAQVLATLESFFPTESRPPNSVEIQNLVANGGLQYEAKLARLFAQEPTSPTISQAASKPISTGQLIGSDLKGNLLHLLQTVRELGSSVPVQASYNLLLGIEAQQATNALAQATGMPYFLQIPFPDSGTWRTLRLAIESEERGSGSTPDQTKGFRMLMHIPLSELGETWIDAGVSELRLRAVLYLEKPSARERVQAELPALRDELLNDGFNAVALDVRPSADLPERHRRRTMAMKLGHPESVSVVDVKV